MNNISKNALVYDSLIDDDVVIGDFSVIGKIAVVKKHAPTQIKVNCIIGSHVIIYEATTIETQTQIEDFCRIGEETFIGQNCRVIYGAKIYGNVTIGNNCIVGGFVCEEVEIGNNCRVFGEFVHSHKINPKDFSDLKKWDEGGELAPKVGDNVFIGFGAKIIGGIKIGNGSYILPNSIVTKDIPENSTVKGFNIIVPFKKFEND